MFRRHMGEIAEAITLAYNNPKVIAMMPFIYQTFDEGGDPKKHLREFKDIPEALSALDFHWPTNHRTPGETEANVDEVARLMKSKISKFISMRGIKSGNYDKHNHQPSHQERNGKPHPNLQIHFPGGGILAFDTTQ